MHSPTPLDEYIQYSVFTVIEPATENMHSTHAVQQEAIKIECPEANNWVDL